MNAVPSEHQVTRLLDAWRRGDERAGETLLPLVYDELRRIARQRLRGEHAALTLQPTALVHEAYLRLADVEHTEFRDRAHFFAFASTVMRRVLVDHARGRLAGKRSHRSAPLTIAANLPGDASRDVELLDLDRALERLAEEHPRQARVVEMRFFAGLEHSEIAEALQITERTVHRDWVFARAWLLAELDGAPG
jgi:RNA polymerase sigma factor (TIGR02999 family)